MRAKQLRVNIITGDEHKRYPGREADTRKAHNLSAFCQGGVQIVNFIEKPLLLSVKKYSANTHVPTGYSLDIQALSQSAASESN